jgi:hypothetical protein
MRKTPAKAIWLPAPSCSTHGTSMSPSAQGNNTSSCSSYKEFSEIQLIHSQSLKKKKNTSILARSIALLLGAAMVP